MLQGIVPPWMRACIHRAGAYRPSIFLQYIWSEMCSTLCKGAIRLRGVHTVTRPITITIR